MKAALCVPAATNIIAKSPSTEVPEFSQTVSALFGQATSTTSD